MKVLCIGHDKPTHHEMRGAEMSLALEAFQTGDAQIVGRNGVESYCIQAVTPLTDESGKEN